MKTDIFRDFATDSVELCTNYTKLKNFGVKGTDIAKLTTFSQMIKSHFNPITTAIA